MAPGKFIVIEGGEGGGKTTNLRFIEKYLRAQGIDLVLTREPGGTPLAEEVRALLLTNRSEPVSAMAELLMIFAARAQHLERCIKPALEQGQWVLCDRFTDATFAYQGGGRGVSDENIETLVELVHPKLWPDLTVLLDVPVEIGRERARARGELDRFEIEKLSFYHAVRDKYLARLAQQPGRFGLVNAGEPLEDVQHQIAAILERFMSCLGPKKD